MGLMLKDIQAKWRNSKATILEMRVSLEKTMAGINILDDSFEWGHSLFDKRSKTVGVSVHGFFEEKLLGGASQSVSMEAHNRAGKGSKPLDFNSRDQLEIEAPSEPGLLSVKKIWHLDSDNLVFP